MHCGGGGAGNSSISAAFKLLRSPASTRCVADIIEISSNSFRTQADGRAVLLAPVAPGEDYCCCRFLLCGCCLRCGGERTFEFDSALQGIKKSPNCGYLPCGMALAIVNLGLRLSATRAAQAGRAAVLKRTMTSTNLESLQVRARCGAVCMQRRR